VEYGKQEIIENYHEFFFSYENLVGVLSKIKKHGCFL